MKLEQIKNCKDEYRKAIIDFISGMSDNCREAGNSIANAIES